MISAHVLRSVAALWLTGNALRLALLAVPPVIPLIQSDLGLSGTEVGILSGIPVVMFAAAALPGSLLIARFGAFATLMTGFALASAGSAARGALPTVGVLFAGTVVMSVGIAIMQPALPALVRQWLPERIAFGTAIYTNGLLIGEIIPASLMISMVMPLVGGSWPLAFLFWGVVTLIIAVATYRLAPAAPKAAVRPSIPARWWPNWRDGLIWRLGFIVGGINASYFGGNAFLPPHLESVGRGDLGTAALTALNLGQLPASFLLLIFASRIERRIWPFVATGILALASIAGIVLTVDGWVVVFATGLGFSAGFGFALALTLPPLLSAPDDVARTAAAMFTISYSLAVILAVLGGAAWDAVGDPRFAFLPVAVGLLPLIILTPTIRFQRSPS
jgi:CP family cyanate transporter-like MFS transporter